MAPAFAAMMIAATTVTARAQDGTVRGVVTDDGGAPVAEADVAIAALQQFTKTDAQGRFMFTKLPPGEHEVTVRRLGYARETVKVIVNAMAYSYSITMTKQATRIAGMDVNAGSGGGRRPIDDFHRRRVSGMGGTFITRDDIEKRRRQQTKSP